MKNFITAFYFLIYSLSINSQQIPNEFVYLNEIDKTIKVDLRYFGNNNFIGKKIDGYEKNCLILTKPTAQALKEVQKDLLSKGLSLKVYDGYRPQQAVNHFVTWAKVLSDTLMKSKYYPNIPKSKLFELGYIASKSGHTRGSTVDLTIVDLKTNKELDMGSPFDFFGKQSHPFYQKINNTQKANRILLREVMLLHGFTPYNKEWWHFTLKNEPFPNKYFNFSIK